MWRPRTLLYTTVDFVNTLLLGYSKLRQNSSFISNNLILAYCTFYFLNFLMFLNFFTLTLSYTNTSLKHKHIVQMYKNIFCCFLSDIFSGSGEIRCCSSFTMLPKDDEKKKDAGKSIKKDKDPVNKSGGKAKKKK